VFTAGSPTPTRVEYRYGINSGDNESAAGNNRIRYIRATGGYQMPLDVFGDIVQEPRELQLGGVAIGFVLEGSVNLTWDGGAGIVLQSRTEFNSADWHEVPNTEAQSSVTLSISNEGQMFYRLTRR